MATHERFLGDEIERAIEIIGQDADGVNAWELLNAYADHEFEPELEPYGNYLHVEVPLEAYRNE